MDQVFGKSWFKKQQSKLLFLLNAPILKIWFRWVLRIRKEDLPLKTKIIDLGPNWFTHSAKLKGDEVELQTSFRSNEKYARRLWFAFEPLWWVFHAWDWLTRPWPELNLGYDSLPTKYSTPGATVSGYAEDGGNNTTFSTLRGFAGDGSAYDGGTAGLAVQLIASATLNQFATLRRSIFLFDTSALDDGVTVSAATISLYVDGTSTYLGSNFDVDIVSSNPASNTALANSSYALLGTTPFSSVAQSSLTDASYAAFALNADGLAAVSKTGISKFGATLNWDTDNNFTGTWEAYLFSGLDATAGGYAGTTRDPKIDVTYTLPATGYANLLLLSVG